MNVFKWQVGELGGKSPIVIPTHNTEFRLCRQLSEKILNPSTLRDTRTGRMNHVAKKNEAFWPELIAHAQQLFARPNIG
jgi:hypothetical protein